MIITRTISITNFVVASSALMFQVCVLYPWHKQLDEDFEDLKKEHLRVLSAVKANAAGAAGAGAAAAAAVQANKGGIREKLGGISPFKA